MKLSSKFNRVTLAGQILLIVIVFIITALFFFILFTGLSDKDLLISITVSVGGIVVLLFMFSQIRCIQLTEGGISIRYPCLFHRRFVPWQIVTGYQYLKLHRTHGNISRIIINLKNGQTISLSDTHIKNLRRFRTALSRRYNENDTKVNKLQINIVIMVLVIIGIGTALTVSVLSIAFSEKAEQTAAVNEYDNYSLGALENDKTILNNYRTYGSLSAQEPPSARNRFDIQIIQGNEIIELDNPYSTFQIRKKPFTLQVTLYGTNHLSMTVSSENTAFYDAQQNYLMSSKYFCYGCGGAMMLKNENSTLYFHESYEQKENSFMNLYYINPEYTAFNSTHIENNSLVGKFSVNKLFNLNTSKEIPVESFKGDRLYFVIYDFINNNGTPIEVKRSGFSFEFTD